MSYKKKILILTADAGFGHRSAANAIASAILDSCGPAYECKIINPIDDPRTPEIIRKPQVDYDRTVLDFPFTYRLSYRISDSYPASMLVQGFIAQFMVRLFQDILSTYTPDVIISTYLIYNSALRSALKRNKLDIAFFMVVTDLADVHHLWFQPGPDKFFVPTEAARREAIVSRVPPQNVFVSGLPVDPRIAQEKRNKIILRQSLGWDPELPTVLAVGSTRVTDLFSKLEAINTCEVPVQLAIVAGGNNELFDAVRLAAWKIPIFCYNYVRNLPEMLHAADLLMTKAGGLITSEALACGLPILFVEAIHGQETGNAEYVCEHSAGVMAKTPGDVGETLSRWLKNDQKVLTEFAQNARELGKPNAAYQIAREVWEATTERAAKPLMENEQFESTVWDG